MRAFQLINYHLGTNLYSTLTVKVTIVMIKHVSVSAYKLPPRNKPIFDVNSQNNSCNDHKLVQSWQKGQNDMTEQPCFQPLCKVVTLFSDSKK